MPLIRGLRCDFTHFIDMQPFWHLTNTPENQFRDMLVLMMVGYAYEAVSSFKMDIMLGGIFIPAYSSGGSLSLSATAMETKDLFIEDRRKCGKIENLSVTVTTAY